MSFVIELPNMYFLINENPPVHNEETQEEVVFENVEEVEVRNEGMLKLHESLPFIQC